MVLLICAGEYRGRTLRGFMAYVYAKLQEHAREQVYRIYMTDAVMTAANNASRFAGGMMIKNRFAEIIEIGSQKQTRTNESAEDIIQRVIKNAGLEVKTS